MHQARKWARTGLPRTNETKEGNVKETRGQERDQLESTSAFMTIARMMAQME